MAERMDDYGAGAARPLDAAGGDAGEIETTVIRAEIVETRERMSDTLDEIGERLNPHVIREQVTERVKDGIRDATIGRMENMARSAADKVSDTRSSIADTVRDNPVPAAMVAIGLGWLMWNGRSERSYDSRRYASGGMAYGAGYPYGGGNAYTGAGDYSGGYAGGYAGGAFESGGSERGAMDRARDKASGATESVKEHAHDLADRAGSVAGAARDRAQDLAGSVADRTRRGAGRVEDGFYANPLAMGAVAAAAGLVAGLAAPTTDREVQLMGGAHDRLVDTVKDKVNDFAQKAETVVERTTNEAKTAAREEGLTAS